MTRPLVEGDRCPVEGCHWVVVLCDCDRGASLAHLVCLGCGQDVEKGADASSPCDCGPDNQPAPDEANYRP